MGKSKTSITYKKSYRGEKRREILDSGVLVELLWDTLIL